MDKTSQAIQYMQKQKFEEAAKLFNETIEDNPKDPIGYVNFGNLLMHMEDNDHAQQFFRKQLHWIVRRRQLTMVLVMFYTKKSNLMRLR